MDGSTDDVDIDFQRLGSIVEPLLSLTLYLCSTEPDLKDAAGGARMPGYPTVIAPTKRRRRVRKGKQRQPPRLQSAEAPTKWDVGYRIGAAIRRSRQEARSTGESPTGTRPSPIPHIRRVHWHTYWTGPKNEPEKRKRVLKWLPPIAVKLDHHDDLISTVRPVKP